MSVISGDSWFLLASPCHSHLLWGHQNITSIVAQLSLSLCNAFLLLEKLKHKRKEGLVTEHHVMFLLNVIDPHFLQRSMFSQLCAVGTVGGTSESF